MARTPARQPPAPPDHTYLHPADVAKRLNVHRNQVYVLVNRGDIEGVKFGRILRITEQSVNAYIAAAHAAARTA
jgi:excisionase family DNA binding protein